MNWPPLTRILRKHLAKNTPAGDQEGKPEKAVDFRITRKWFGPKVLVYPEIYTGRRWVKLHKDDRPLVWSLSRMLNRREQQITREICHFMQDWFKLNNMKIKPPSDKAAKEKAAMVAAEEKKTKLKKEELKKQKQEREAAEIARYKAKQKAAQQKSGTASGLV